ncbi:MAG: helicase-related protein, partial [Thermodesulfobacteriota bacterium]|nr:helicase-related protein [Thermodesulfobacteriota bacterium]
VGTTEVLRNQLYDVMHLGIDLPTDLVILDEAHFLGDEERGVVWEEIMIYLPARINLLLLSATIGNVKQIANWLESIRAKKCVVVEETKRPVPLFPLFFHPTGRLLPLMDSRNVDKKVQRYLKSKSSAKILPSFDKMLRVLEQYNLLPVIFFLKGRNDCNNALEVCLNRSCPDELKRSKIDEILSELTVQYPSLRTHTHLMYLKNAAVAAHHSGQLPAWKLAVEELMTEGLLDAVFATSTVAAGVNFPARSVVFLNSDRFNGHEFVPLNATQFHQMTGRAGRRGMDRIGFAIITPGRFMNVNLMATLYSSQPENIISQIRVDFSMVLNLLLSHSPEEIKEIFQRSFATYLLKQAHKKPQSDKQLWDKFLQYLDFLKEENFVREDNTLTEEGKWASQLRIDQPLMIAEGLRKGVFTEFDPVLLAAQVAPFVYDREVDDEFDESLVPKRLIKAYHKMVQSLLPLIKRKKKKGFEVRQIPFWPAATVYSWASGEQWETILEVSGLTEGDCAMLISRTADNLRQIASLTTVYPQIAKVSSEAIARILREPIIESNVPGSID